MPHEIVFYTNPMSRGRIVRWMLEETGAPYRTEVVEYGPAMKAPEYLALNPMGKVPTLVHGEVIVTECAAICAYLADTFPDAGLAPPPPERGAYYRWLFFAAGPLEAATTNRAFNLEPPADKQGMVGYGNFDLVVNTLEIAVSGADYIAGTQFTAADVYVGSHVGWGMQYGMLPERDAFKDYWFRVSDRDAYRHANELDEAAMPADGD